MSDRDWLKRRPPKWLIRVIIAVLVLTVGGGAIVRGLTEQAEYERASYQRNSEYTAETYSPAYNTCISPTTQGQANCVAKANSEYRENERKEQDLIAQQTTAVWTFLMGCAAIIGMMLSGLGVYLVWTTFAETRKSNQIAEGDQRPWIDVVIDKISMANSETTFSVSVVIKIKNLGRTPAFRVESRARISTAQNPQNEEWGAYFPDKEYTRITHNLLPSGEGSDHLYPSVPVDRIKMIKIIMDKKSAVPLHFFPLIQLKIDYEWGSQRTKCKTVKNFAISAVRVGADERTAYPIFLGDVPVPEIRAFEVGVAEIT